MFMLYTTYSAYRAAAKARKWSGTPHHGRTSCDHIFIEGTRVEPQKRMVVKFYFGGSYILQSVFHVIP